MGSKTKVLIFSSVFALIIISLQVILAFFKKDILGSFEWYGKVIITLLITLILTYATKSYAKVTGTYLSYHFQISGAIVVFAIIFISSYFKELFLGDKDFSFAVQIQNYNPSLMPKDMEIYFISGTYIVSEPINIIGIAVFPNIKSNLKNTTIFLQLKNSEGYEINKQNQNVVIDINKNIDISLQRVDYLTGMIFNNHQPVDSAGIYIYELDTTIYSLKGRLKGQFKLKVTEAQKSNYSLNIRKGELTMKETITLNSYSEYDFNNP
jgi:hypothetical protein